MHNNLLVVVIFATTSHSVLSRSPSPTPHSEASPPTSTSSAGIAMPMETMMLKEFHDLCMSGIVPEAGMIITGPSGRTFQHWLYCSQRQSGTAIATSTENLTSSSPENFPAVSFVEPAPVEQMHRIILNKKRVSGSDSDAPKPPTVYVMPPKIRNQYTVDLIHEEDQYKNISSTNQQFVGPPPEPIIYFLNGESNSKIPENKDPIPEVTTSQPNYYYANRAHPDNPERKTIIVNYSKIRA